VDKEHPMIKFKDDKDNEVRVPFNKIDCIIKSEDKLLVYMGVLFSTVCKDDQERVLREFDDYHAPAPINAVGMGWPFNVEENTEQEWE
jgi:hypothetical protein